MQSKLAEVSVLIKQSKPPFGSEKALAESMLEAMLAIFKGNVVYTGGEGIYVYDADAGLWKHLDDNKLFSLVLDFDGMWVAKRTKINMSAAKGFGIVKCFKQLKAISNPEFFADTKPVVALQNTVLECTKHGVTQVVAAPEHKLRLCLPHKYDAKIQPTNWLNLLNQVFEPDADKVKKIALIQEFLGASLIGQAPRFDKCLIFTGSGSNGKSTLLDIIQLLVDNYTSIPPQKWEDEYYVAMLDGKLLNLVSEMPETKLVHSEQFKAIVSGESVVARSPYELPQRIRPIAGHIFAANELPPSDDNADGYWRRFFVIGFNRVFPGGKTRHQIREEMLLEVPGILRWCLEGAVRLLNQGEYSQPESHKDTLENWREESDSVAAWAKYHVKPLEFPQNDVCTWLKSEGFISSSARNFYVNWCNAEGYKPVGARKFKRRMETLGFQNMRLATGVYWAIRVEVVGAPTAPTLEDKPVGLN